MKKSMVELARRRAGRTLLGACLGIGFLLPQLVLALHLARNDHVLVAGVDAHVHTHDAHLHAHAAHAHEGAAPTEVGASESGGANQDHEPHPLEEHVEQLGEPAVAPAVIHVALIQAPAAPWFGVLEALLPERVRHTPRIPRPPPPRTAAAPRAPPIVT